LPSIIRVFKSKRLRWAGLLHELGNSGTLIDYWWVNQKEGDHQKDQDVGGWIILGWILERWGGVIWTGLVRLRIGIGGELL
jgi:hypothetical protein